MWHIKYLLCASRINCTKIWVALQKLNILSRKKCHVGWTLLRFWRWNVCMELYWTLLLNTGGVGTNFLCSLLMAEELIRNEGVRENLKHPKISSLGLVQVYEYTLECLSSYHPSICFYASSKYHELDMVRMHQQECCIDYIPYHKKWANTRYLCAYRICSNTSNNRKWKRIQQS